MPTDYRRFNGPEDSVCYKRFTKKYYKTYEELQKELLDSKGFRHDGRKLEDAKHMFANTNVVSQAKGSAYIERKETKVICSVFDPREIPHQNEFSQLGQIFCEVKFAPFSCPRKRRPHAPEAEEKALSVALRQALEPAVCRHMFPNFQLDVFVFILQHDGGCLAAAINAAGLALVDAAVPMYDMITATSIAVIGEQIFLDPSEAEEHVAIISPSQEINHGVITISMLLELKQICNFTQIGSMDMDCVNKVMDLLETQCQEIMPNLQKVVVSNVMKAFEERKILDEQAKEQEKILDEKIDQWKKKLKGG